MNNVNTCWKALGASVQGVMHKRNRLPNQDGLAFSTDDKTTDGLPALIAVSDGHGSPSYFRSKRGAKLAVLCAKHLLFHISKTILQKQLYGKALEDGLRYDIPKKMVQFWVDQVLKDVKKRPYTKEEQKKIQAFRDSSSEVQKNIRPYGATLLAVLLTENFCMYFQLGDGEILQVASNNSVQRIFLKNDNCIANETHSLCEPEAWRNSYFLVQPMVDSEFPELILASTDGYSNSFVNDEEFLQVGTDMVRIMREQGKECVEACLSTWLDQASNTGSGDDVTVGILTCIDQEGAE